MTDNMTRDQAKRERIINGIAVYAHEQRLLLRVLRMRGGSMTEREFDKLFRGKRRSRFHHITPETFILLGGLGASTWSLMLDLMQHMMLLGLINSRKDRYGVVYSLPSEKLQ